MHEAGKILHGLADNQTAGIATATMQRCADFLIAQGVCLSVIRCGWGGATGIEFGTGHDVVKYLEDPVSFIAQREGVMKQQYLDWVACEGNIYCEAVTKARRRCKNLSIGGHQVAEPLEWVKLKSLAPRCRVHG